MNFSALRMLGMPPRIIIQTNEQWIDGYKACAEGKGIGDNPFMTETDESDSWLAGPSSLRG